MIEREDLFSKIMIAKKYDILKIVTIYPCRDINREIERKE